MMKDFRKYEVWEKAHALTVAVYRVTNDFPKDELFGLTSQMRRASSSIPANIAEGCGRDTVGDFARFLQIAAGSASELEYHLLLAHDIDLLTDAAYQPLDDEINRVKRMLNALMKKLKSSEQLPARKSQKPTTKSQEPK